MKNKVTVLAPARMKEVYCHKCGDLLMKHANTRIVKRGDPDYKKHSRLGRGRYVIGDIELTEYDLECMTCKTYISYDEQRPIMMVQKELGKNILSDEELDAQRPAVQKKLDRRARIWKAFGIAIAALFFGFYLYRFATTGELPIRFEIFF